MKTCYIFLQLFFLSVVACKGMPSKGGLEIVNNGKSAYQILIDEKSTSGEVKAAREFQTYIKNITGVELPITTDKGTAEQIVFGDRNYIKSIYPQIDFNRLGEDGFVIKTVGEKVIFAGGSDRGSLYAVYSFLENFLHCKMYAPDEVVIPKRKSINLDVINIEEIPRIRYREVYFSPSYDPLYANWHKVDHFMKTEGLQSKWGNWVHSFFTFVPPELYLKSHPEYFALRDGKRVATQLCLSNSGVYDIILKKLRQEIKSNPQAIYWAVSQQDNDGYCECEKCTAIYKRESSQSGAIISLVNKVADNFPDKIIATLAYGYSVKPPRYIKPNKNVQVIFCTSGSIDRGKVYNLDAKNGEYTKNLIAWGKITNHLLIWDYVVNYKHFFMPYPNLSAIPGNIRFFTKNGATALFMQGEYYPGSEFSQLKTYLISKLMWNPEADANSIVEDFLNGYYGAAAPFVKQYISALERNYQKSAIPLGTFDNPDLYLKGYLSLEALDEYTQILAKAESSVIADQNKLNRVKVLQGNVDYAYLNNALLDPMSLKRSDIKLNVRTAAKSDGGNSLAGRLESVYSAMKISKMTRIDEGNKSPEIYKSGMEKLTSITSGLLTENLAIGSKLHLTYPASKIHAKYAGDLALIDGVRGNLTSGLDTWEGFYGGKMEAVIEFDKSKKVKSVSMNFMKALNVSVNYPEEIRFLYSLDGVHYKDFQNMSTEVSETYKSSETKLYSVTSKGITCRFIKIIASCPRNYAMFTDEILIQ